MIELTDEMREAFQVAAGWPGPPWRFGPDVANGLTSVLALVERDQRAEVEADVASERERIRQVLSGPFLAVLRCVPDGRIQNGCVVHDGKTVRERARQAYLTAFTNNRDGRS